MISLQTKKFADVIIPRGADNTGIWFFFFQYSISNLNAHLTPNAKLKNTCMACFSL